MCQSHDKKSSVLFFLRPVAAESGEGARGACPPLSKSIHFGPLTFCFCTVRFCICSSFTLINCVPITRVTAISTLCEVMSKDKSTKDVFSQVHKLLQIYLCTHVQCNSREELFGITSIEDTLKSDYESRMTESSALPSHS